jgi:nucleoside-triphosphatase THEP1
VPWSELGHDFIETWGHKEDGSLADEHLEVTGQTGSGKSYATATILQQRAQRWDSPEIAVVTKQQDDSIPLLGWPVVQDYDGLRDYRQAVFWPQTRLQGAEREKFHEKRIYELLTKLWQPDANCVISFDEIGYVEDLSRRLRKQIRMMWREARSTHISMIASKQRPVGVVRDQHSESRWKIVFPPADMGDMKRFAELLGRPADWAPVLESLDQERHQFVIRNNVTKLAYISWIDSQLRPLPSQQHQRPKNVHEAMYGQQNT